MGEKVNQKNRGGKEFRQQQKFAWKNCSLTCQGDGGVPGMPGMPGQPGRDGYPGEKGDRGDIGPAVSVRQTNKPPITTAAATNLWRDERLKKNNFLEFF